MRRCSKGESVQVAGENIDSILLEHYWLVCVCVKRKSFILNELSPCEIFHCSNLTPSHSLTLAHIRISPFFRACSGELELPSVHFLCMHSFCQNCVPEGEREGERECVECGPRQRDLFNIKASLKTKANEHEQFFTELANAPDGFAKVREWGKNGGDHGREKRERKRS